MSYNKKDWHNLPDISTPISATNLNYMEEGIADANGAIGVNAYDNTATYAVNDLCIYNNTLYICITAIINAENWNSTHWKEISVKDMLIAINESDGKVTEMNKTINVSNINGALALSGGTMTGDINSQQIVPKTNNAYDLGNAGFLYKDLYLYNKIISPNWNQYSSGATLVIGVEDMLAIRASNDINTSKPVQASAFNTWSSKRYKENIKNITDERANLLDDIQIVTYDYKNSKSGTNLTGVIAEEVENIIPEVVTYAEIDGEKVPDTVDYSKFVPYLIKKVQMLQDKINKIEKKVN